MTESSPAARFRVLVPVPAVGRRQGADHRRRAHGAGGGRVPGRIPGLLRDGYVARLRRDDAPAAALRRQCAFWFEMAGVALLLLGAQTAVLEQRGVCPPRTPTGWALTGAARDVERWHRRSQRDLGHRRHDNPRGTCGNRRGGPR